MRIKTIASFIEKANVCVDVGSDHAYLSLLLVENNKSNIVYNIEKNPQPLQNSINNTKQYSNKIFNILSDGFKSFDNSIDIDYCVIAGMGATTIIEILSKCLNNVKYYIICANNGYDKLREWIKNNKFKIYNETTILENNIYYEIICFSKLKGKKLIFKKDIEFGIRKIKKLDKYYIDKLKAELLKKDYESLKEKNKNLYKKCKRIERYIEKYGTY
ncbi:class I SAM-dependent methyltransferase [Malacoplasma muris]|uniref:class I SAM-dependent methyltransferase n=1 Tax=Malacoplasma muris TaxID=2119 RepID=UPI00398EDE39